MWRNTPTKVGLPVFSFLTYPMDFEICLINVPGTPRLSASLGAQLLGNERGKVGFPLCSSHRSADRGTSRRSRLRDQSGRSVHSLPSRGAVQRRARWVSLGHAAAPQTHAGEAELATNREMLI